MAINAESLTELILETQSTYTTIEAELTHIQARAAELMEQRDLLKQEEEAFRSSLARRFPGTDVPGTIASDAGPEVQADKDDDWVEVSRSAVVERVIKLLTENKGFATPAEIENYLREKGRDDSRDNIGAALAYLNRTKKVHSRARAEWVHGLAS